MKNDLSGRSILIFPGGMPRSLDYLHKCARDGCKVIGASSLGYDIAREQYANWLHLPYVTQPEFNERLKRAILELNIGGIYSPNNVVWGYLNRVLKDISPDVLLVNDEPADEEMNGYRAARKYASDLLFNPLPLISDCQPKSSISVIELASLFRHADLIPGMCSHEKLNALCEITRYGVSGDVVEIGSWWGKSAFILARLAYCYNIGCLLCVDPWSDKHLTQHDGEGLVDHASTQVSAEEALLVFEMNLLPYSFNNVNYLRMPSIDGAKYYQQQRSVTTTAFGATNYCGHISILHIDGNHSYAAAKADIAAWSVFVIDDGWIIIDDYNWPYGNGPKCAADEFLTANASRLKVAFVMGGALFLQLTSQRLIES